MHITGFQMDGFGVFHDVSVSDLSPRLVIITGENEAGKSTCLAFFRHLLSGFPSRQKKLNLYPPLNGGKHGGRIQMQAPTIAPAPGIVLQRHAGPKGGHITLTQSDGAMLDPNLLQTLLAGVSSDLFRSVFAFSLDELQTFASLRSDEVATALFTAGTGTALQAYPKARKKLNERVKELYSKKSHKSQIQLTLRDMKETEKHLHVATSELRNYAHLSELKQSLDAQLQELTQTLESKERDLLHTRNLLKLWPHWQTYSHARQALHEMPSPPDQYPAQAETRLEDLLTQHETQNRKINEYRHEITRLRHQARQMPQLPFLYHYREAIRSVLPMRTTLQTLDQDLKSQAQQINTLSSTLKTALVHVGGWWSKETLAQWQHNLELRDQLEHLRKRREHEQATQQTIHERVVQYKQRYTETQHRLQEQQETHKDLKQQMDALSQDPLTALLPQLTRIQYLLQELPETERKLQQERETCTNLCQAQVANWDLTHLLSCDLSSNQQQQAQAYKVQLADQDADLKAKQAAHQEANRACEQQQKIVDNCAGTIDALALPPVTDEASLKVYVHDMSQCQSELATLHHEQAQHHNQTARLQTHDRIITVVLGFLALLSATSLALIPAQPAFLTPYTPIANLVAFGVLFVGLVLVWTMRHRQHRKLADADKALTTKQTVLTNRLHKLCDAFDLPMGPQADYETVLATLHETVQQAQATLQKHDWLTAEKHQYEITLKQAQETARAAAVAENESRNRMTTLEQQWHTWLKQSGYGDLQALPEALPYKLDTLQQLQERATELQRDEKRLDETVSHAWQNLVTPDLRVACNKAGHDITHALRKTVEYLQKYQQDQKRLCQQLQRIEQDIAETQRDLAQIDASITSVETEETDQSHAVKAAEQAWRKFLKQHRLPETLTPEAAREAFETLRNAREDLLRLNELEIQHDQTTHERQAQCLAIRDKLKPLNPNATDAQALHQLLNDLEKKLTESESLAAQRKRIAGQIRNQRQAMQLHVSEKEQTHSRLQTLYQKAGTNNEESFRTVIAREKRRNGLLATLEVEKNALFIGLNVQTCKAVANTFADRTETALENQTADLEQAYNELQAEREQVRNKLAECQAQLSNMTSNDQVQAYRQELEDIRTQLREQAWEWAHYRIADYLLDEARRAFEKEKQPGVLKEATRFLSTFTDGNYTNILAPLGEDRLTVVTSENTQKTPEQLSRGTVEQLYLSLRLGFVVSNTACREQLPLFMDDVFVNFDPARTRRAARVLTELTRRHQQQVFYFTCHPHVVDALTTENEHAQVWHLAPNQIVKKK